MRIGIIDIKAGNIFSVVKAFKSLDSNPEVVDSSQNIKDFTHIVIPGVAAYKTGADFLKKNNFSEEIIKHINKGKPLLGLCLGCQLLMDKSFEFGEHQGLGVISGDVNKIKITSSIKVPHVGWKPLKINNAYKNTILSDMTNNNYVYFTHSFVCEPKDKKNCLATFNYGDKNLIGAIINDNIIGLQFHPEISGSVGRKILKKFINL
jgi:glutamine amidotransferase